MNHLEAVDMTFRERKHRYSDLPFKDVLKIRMAELEVKNVDLQKALGYAAPNVIAMMKSGSMRLPESKAIEVADILQLDRIFVLGKVVSEHDPQLWDAIISVAGDRLVSANELALVYWLRQVLKGHDVNLTESAEFMRFTSPVVSDIVERHNALAKAALLRAGA